MTDPPPFASRSAEGAKGASPTYPPSGKFPQRGGPCGKRRNVMHRMQWLILSFLAVGCQHGARIGRLKEAGAPFVAREAAARVELAEKNGKVVIIEEKAGVMPHRMYGGPAKPAWLIDNADELRVAWNVERSMAPLLLEKVGAGNSLLCVHSPDRTMSIKEIEASIDKDEKTIVVRVQLVHASFPARSGPTPRAVKFPRAGFGVKVLMGFPAKNGKHTEWKKVLDTSGGGLSPLDSQPNRDNLIAAIAAEDALAIRRYLRAKLRAKDHGFDAEARGLLRASDPYTAYWAARVIASAGGFVMLKKAIVQHGFFNGLDEHVVSAIYQAASETEGQDARDFLLDNGLFHQVDLLGGVYRPEWLALAIAGYTTSAEEAALLRQLQRAASSREEKLFAVDILLWRGNPKVLGPIFLLLKDIKWPLRKTVLDKMYGMVEPPEHEHTRHGGLIMKDGRPLSEWFDNPQELLNWWKKNQGNVVWNQSRRKYQVNRTKRKGKQP
jgi:hypothetical protein